MYQFYCRIQFNSYYKYSMHLLIYKAGRERPQKLIITLTILFEARLLRKSANSEHIRVDSNGSYSTLAHHCGIRGADLLKFTSQLGLHASQEERDHIYYSDSNYVLVVIYIFVLLENRTSRSNSLLTSRYLYNAPI